MTKSIEKKHLIEIYEGMKRIRMVEEEIANRYSEQEMRCPTHLSIGQECVPAVANCFLTNKDYAVSTHRSHAHYLGKGGSPKRMIAEIYGKETGCAGGRGGSMHLIDLECGFRGSTAIVGNSIPLGVGLAMAQKLDNKKDLTIVYLGDAAVEEGSFYESANFAVLKNLPVLFLCENNMYSVYTHIKKRQPNERAIHKMAEGIGLKTDFTDGNDFQKSYNSIGKACEDIRNGGGPWFIELTTYRWREHCGPNYDNDIGYRTEEEFQEWKKQDPIVRLEKHFLENSIMAQSDLDEIHNSVDKEVQDAFTFALESKFPTQESAFKYLYK